MRNNLFTLALLAALTVGGSANAAWQLNGKSMNGKSMNGKSMNGKSMNGKSMNGKSMNGKSMNGKSMNGKSMNGTVLAAESFHLSGVQVIDGRLVVAE